MAIGVSPASPMRPSNDKAMLCHACIAKDPTKLVGHRSMGHCNQEHANSWPIRLRVETTVTERALRARRARWSHGASSLARRLHTATGRRPHALPGCSGLPSLARPFPLAVQPGQPGFTERAESKLAGGRASAEPGPDWALHNVGSSKRSSSAPPSSDHTLLRPVGAAHAGGPCRAQWCS